MQIGVFGQKFSRRMLKLIPRRFNRALLNALPYRGSTGSIKVASLFFCVFKRVLTGVATIWVSGYCFITLNASSWARVSHASRSSLVRIAGIRCLTLWISAISASRRIP